MPGVFAPTVAARIELMLIDVGGGLRMEDVLIAFYQLSSAAPSMTLAAPGSGPSRKIPKLTTRKLSRGGEAEVEPCGATSRIALKVALTY
jgi:hypothetical protein